MRNINSYNKNVLISSAVVAGATRPLLFVEDGELDDDTDETLFDSDSGCNKIDYKNSNNNNNNLIKNSRHHVHRGAKRMAKIFIASAGIVIIYLLIYIPIFNSLHSRRMALPDWGYNQSRNIADYILPNDDIRLIETQNVCSNNLFLLIVVCSSIHNFASRQTIRESWGNIKEFNYPIFQKIHSHMRGTYLDIRELNLRTHSNYLNMGNMTVNYSNLSNYEFPVKIVFLIGRDNNLGNETLFKLKFESEQNDDLIQENFIDSYNNLTLKSVMMLKWINKKCSDRIKFIIKCDDDTFINIPNLLHYLLGGTVPVYNDTVEIYDPKTVNALSPSNRLQIDNNLLTGYLFCNVKPVADVKSKWCKYDSPLYMFDGNIYPNYLSGSSYLMSVDVVQKLFNATLNASILHLEDVYLTGICAEKIRLRRRHNPLFLFNHNKNLCSYKGIITQHYLKGELMMQAYNFVKNTTIKCPMPDKYFKIKRLKKRPRNCV